MEIPSLKNFAYLIAKKHLQLEKKILTWLYLKIILTNETNQHIVQK